MFKPKAVNPVPSGDSHYGNGADLQKRHHGTILPQRKILSVWREDSLPLDGGGLGGDRDIWSGGEGTRSGYASGRTG